MQGKLSKKYLLKKQYKSHVLYILLVSFLMELYKICPDNLPGVNGQVVCYVTLSTNIHIIPLGQKVPSQKDLYFCIYLFKEINQELKV